MTDKLKVDLSDITPSGNVEDEIGLKPTGTVRIEMQFRPTEPLVLTSPIDKWKIYESHLLVDDKTGLPDPYLYMIAQFTILGHPDTVKKFRAGAETEVVIPGPEK